MERLHQQVSRHVTLLLLLATVTLPGCLSGLIVNVTTEPLVTNMKGTPIGTRRVTLDRHQIREPLTRLQLRAEWASNAIGDAAKRKGLKKVYYADLHTLSILFGIYQQKEVIVYGD